MKENSSPNTEHIVLADVVVETTADTIRLRCNKTGLENMAPFINRTFIEEKVPVEHQQDPAVRTGCAAGYRR
ncbi:MAG: hypothetical protein MUP11_04180 [Anaerolineales bacterium]|nr:hypothetical protein [Anaerolineales bacterium]